MYLTQKDRISCVVKNKKRIFEFELWTDVDRQRGG